ncbi:Short-chain dehydrogenase/reductase family 42E member 1 [Bienertia sinuspersici]
MSGKEMLQIAKINKVNIDATHLILDFCIEFGIKRLVYVSSYNVVFGGKEIVNGDETLPYLPLDNHTDPYSRSKAVAEHLVLNYNGRNFRENGGCLYSCAVRPAAVYGPGENRLFRRMVNYAKLGLLLAKVGDANVKTDWVYVDNLVHGSPANTFKFIRPLLESLEYHLPKSSLSVPLALVLGKICQAFYTILYPLLNISWLPQPLILPAEVYQVFFIFCPKSFAFHLQQGANSTPFALVIGVTHYFSSQKAEKELGYGPKVSTQEGMAAMITYWKDRKRRNIDGPTIYAWLFCVFGLSGLFAVNFLPDIGPVPFLRTIALFIFRSMSNLQIASGVVAIAHSLEAIFAWFLAKRVDPANATGWFWQTLLIATFSLRLLFKRAGPAVN